MRRLCYCSSGEMKNVFDVLRSENGVLFFASLSAHRMDLRKLSLVRVLLRFLF